MAREAGVKRLLLAHHDPTYSDEKLQIIVDNARAYQAQDEALPSCEIVVAYEGLMLDLSHRGVVGAERMLRPAVITRKTGGCNRTEQGADTHAILSSILVTCRQQSISIIDFLVELQRADVPPSLVPP